MEETNKKKRLFTSEHIAPGHPDKVCDTISDSILDAHYSENPSVNTRVAVETLVKGGKVVLAGEVTSEAKINYRETVRRSLEEIGYIPEISPLFNTRDFELEELFTEQSPDIAACVSREEIGAGDQGIMFGYAVCEAPDYTGWAHYIARNIVSEIWKAKLANDSVQQWCICPDYKVQVTMDYSGDIPKVDTVLVSVSHTLETNFEDLKKYIYMIVRVTLDEIHAESVKICREIKIDEYQILVNPYGPFTVFGPVADSGLTGRKIVCDQYGGYAPVGGGAFSGKDLTKVDRTAAYMARFVAKNLLNRLASYSDQLPNVKSILTRLRGPVRDCSVEVAYIIGCAKPVSVTVKLSSVSGKTVYLTDKQVSKLIGMDVYEAFKPEAIIEFLKLFAVDYSEVAKFGHIGLDTTGIRKPWEQLV